eukprot:TRINITY_DN612_c0_g1_i1.p2 TRINITY_DN612_c0_g1~~TRINITY_DN612_c0_g1_i1.p2  ORF type:complete len:129 (-),score=18.49 TRINITY_DN612_c0_g1_i1:156-542(-)
MSHREIGVAYLLWFFLGVFGAHRFYLGRTGTGFLWLFTLGLFGIGWLVDAFLIPGMVHHYNHHHAYHQDIHHSPSVVVVPQYAPATYGTAPAYGAPAYAPVAPVVTPVIYESHGHHHHHGHHGHHGHH